MNRAVLVCQVNRPRQRGCGRRKAPRQSQRRTSVVKPIIPEDPGLQQRVSYPPEPHAPRRARTHPPCSQMIHGSVLFAPLGAVSEPFAPGRSNAQKKSVSFGWPARPTGMLPA